MDEDLVQGIDRLVAEEHALRRRRPEEVTEADRQRARAIEVQLDRCWDLLRQRRARRTPARTPARPTSAPPRSWSTTSSERP